jgi:hypothetical protein
MAVAMASNRVAAERLEVPLLKIWLVSVGTLMIASNGGEIRHEQDRRDPNQVRG